MKNNYKNLIISGIILAFSNSIAFAQSASNSNADLKSTAKMENTCLMSVDNILFGQVFAPLTSQVSQSQMKVLCNNNASYKIELAYGGVYGTGGSTYNPADIRIVTDLVMPNFRSYKIYVKDEPVSALRADIECNNQYNNKVGILSNEMGVILNGKKGNFVSISGICSGVTAYAAGFANIPGSPSYAYGVMNGGLSGDKLAYKITVPGDTSKVWNAGNSSYTATGTGAEQIVNVNAQIVPGNSTSLYPAQDMYTDIITAVISY